jgi:hypothetical protein
MARAELVTDEALKTGAAAHACLRLRMKEVTLGTAGLVVVVVMVIVRCVPRVAAGLQVAKTEKK